MKVWSLTLFILISSLSFAQDHDCSDHKSDLSNLLDIPKHLEWEAASITNVRNAHCTRKNNVTSDEMNSWLAANRSPKNVSKTINGIKFENESPEDLKSFEYLTTVLDIFEKPVPSRQKKFSSKCTKVDCAVKEIFGKEVGTQLLFMHRKYGMNGSHLVRDSSSSWKKSELDSILLALTDFPEGIFPVEKNRPLVHFSRGYMRGANSGRVIANAVIEIFDLWNEQSPEEKRNTLTHELGHVLGGVTNIDENPKWMKLSGWEKNTKVVNGVKKEVVKSKSPEKIVSKYGLTNHYEDFAEAVVAYRYNPHVLKKVSPEKYELIKEVIFDNVEYTSKEACLNPNRLSQSIKKQGQQAVNNWKPSPSELKEIGAKCSEEVVIILNIKRIANLSDKEIQNCYKNAIDQKAKAIGLQTIQNHPNKDFLAPMLRNMKFNPMHPEKMKAMITQVRITHREVLKSEFKKAFKGRYHFRPESKQSDFQYSYQAFDKGLGFDSYQKRTELANITFRASEQIKKNGSLRRWLDLDYSDSEISDQVDSMFK